MPGINVCKNSLLIWILFFFQQADAPNTGLIPESDAVGVTVVLITCTYRGQEFIRIGYYVNNEYTEPELRENPPIKPDYTQVRELFDFWVLIWLLMSYNFLMLLSLAWGNTLDCLVEE